MRPYQAAAAPLGAAITLPLHLLPAAGCYDGCDSVQLRLPLGGIRDTGSACQGLLDGLSFLLGHGFQGVGESYDCHSLALLRVGASVCYWWVLRPGTLSPPACTFGKQRNLYGSTTFIPIIADFTVFFNVFCYFWAVFFNSFRDPARRVLAPWPRAPSGTRIKKTEPGNRPRKLCKTSYFANVSAGYYVFFEGWRG